MGPDWGIVSLQPEKVGAIEAVAERRQVESGDCLAGVLWSGRMDFRIPELGARREAGCRWFLLADRGANTEILPERGTEGIGILARWSIGTETGTESRMCGGGLTECLTCERRTAAFYVSGRSRGRMLELARESVSPGAGDMSSRLRRMAHCYEMLALMFEQPELQAPAPCKTGICEKTCTRLEEVARYLSEHLDEEHSLAGLSRRCFINEFKLKSGFREVYGTTVFGYLRRKRMEAARRLLERYGVTVLEAANAVGYTNGSHFARAFRGVHGINPGEVSRADALTSK